MDASLTRANSFEVDVHQRLAFGFGLGLAIVASIAATHGGTTTACHRNPITAA